MVFFKSVAGFINRPIIDRKEFLVMMFVEANFGCCQCLELVNYLYRDDINC